MSYRLLPALVLLLAACAPGETTFVLGLVEEQELGDDDDSAGQPETELVVTSEHDVTCTNDDVWYQGRGGDLIVVQGGTKSLTVSIDALECTGLPDEVQVARFFVRWSDDALGVFGFEVSGSEGAAVGVDLLGPGEPRFAGAFDFDAERVGSGVGGPFDLQIRRSGDLFLGGQGDEACGCDALRLSDLQTDGTITRNGDPIDD